MSHYLPPLLKSEFGAIRWATKAFNSKGILTPLSYPIHVTVFLSSYAAVTSFSVQPPLDGYWCLTLF